MKPEQPPAEAEIKAEPAPMRESQEELPETTKVEGEKAITVEKEAT